MAFGDLIDITRWTATEVTLLGLGLAIFFTVAGYGIAWLWKRFVDPRRAG